MSESGILVALLSFVKPIDKNRESRDWTISQFEELQLLSMSVLCVLIPLLLTDYLTLHGNNRLLVFLDWCSKNEGIYEYFFYSVCKSFSNLISNFFLNQTIMSGMETVFTLKVAVVVEKLNSSIVFAC